MFASSRIFCRRCVCRPISRTSCFRVRVRSRSSWMGRGGTKLPRIKPMRQQIRQPLRVIDVALAARHILDVLGVGQRQLELALEQMPDGLPVDARRFHGDVGDLVARQPVRQFQQAARRGRHRQTLIANRHGPPRCARRRRPAARGHPNRHTAHTAAASHHLRVHSQRGVPVGEISKSCSPAKHRGHTSGCSRDSGSHSLPGSTAPRDGRPRC